MSKWMMTSKFFSTVKQFCFAFSLTFIALFFISNNTAHQDLQVQLPSSCMAIDSSLPMHDASHACTVSNMSAKSWISWLSGESKSTHLHFIDLMELINYSFR